MDIIKKFEEFLKKEKALAKFEENFYSDVCCGVGFNRGITLGSYFKTEKSSDYIIGAFSWLETEEGDVYWRALDKAWRKICKEVK